MYIWSIGKLKSRYVYQYLDHLGNVRLSYSDLDKSGDIDKETEIIEENNYYPFGLKHRGYNEIVNAVTEHKSRFNDTEFDADFDLNWYNMPLRHQDPTTGRWNGIDPVTHFSSSTYASHNNNPVFWADPSGADGVVYIILAGGYNRASASKIGSATQATLDHFRFDMQVVILNSVSDLPDLDSTDNWVVLGDDRKAMIKIARTLNAEWVKKDLDSDNWVNHRGGEPEVANDEGMGIVMDVSFDHNLRRRNTTAFNSDIIASALTIAHALGHSSQTIIDYYRRHASQAEGIGHLDFYGKGIGTDGSVIIRSAYQVLFDNTPDPHSDSYYETIPIAQYDTDKIKNARKSNHIYMQGMRERYGTDKRLLKRALTTFSSFFFKKFTNGVSRPKGIDWNNYSKWFR